MIWIIALQKSRENCEEHNNEENDRDHDNQVDHDDTIWS